MSKSIPFSAVQVLETKLTAEQKLAAFGLTNSLLQVTTEQDQALLHFWTLPKTVILGLKDKRLPALTPALETLTQAGYDYFLRNSGGLAVVSDGGILNVSLFLPQMTSHLTVDEAYEIMKQILAKTFSTLVIESFEVVHSYCPGDYDLSVDGVKFAGLAQRRTTTGLVVMAYLSITGNQTLRGEMIRTFYQTGLANHPNDLNFPDVWPESMANLSDLLATTLNVDDAKQAILNALVSLDISIDTTSLSELTSQAPFQELYQQERQRMQKRQSALPTIRRF